MLTQHSPNSLQSSLNSLMACSVSHSICTGLRMTLGWFLFFFRCRKAPRLLLFSAPHTVFPVTLPTILQMHLRSGELSPSPIFDAKHLRGGCCRWAKDSGARPDRSFSEFFTPYKLVVIWQIFQPHTVYRKSGTTSVILRV